MIETLFLIIMAAGIGLYHDINKPTKYELSMEDGSNTHVVLQKNSNYACPLYCEVDHMHHAVVCKDGEEIVDNQLLYHISESKENGISVYCSSLKILSMSKLTPRTPNNKKPDVVSASKEY